MPDGYFIRIAENAQYQAWKIDDHSATRLGVSNAKAGAGCYFEAAPGETIWEAMRRQTSWFDGGNPFYQSELEAGWYYPRMSRPSYAYPTESPGTYPNYKNEVVTAAQSRGQLETLVEQLRDICRTIHPCTETFTTFGHKIRNLLILSSTEVEAHWRGVLVANGVTRKRYTTADYVVLRKAMRLDEYAVTFSEYPWLMPMRPFLNWGASGNPTADLKWYGDYNGAKHNREVEFARASLLSAFQAVSACFIMIVAQYGPHALPLHSPARAFFEWAELPRWELSQVYIFPHERVSWTAVPYSFPC